MMEIASSRKTTTKLLCTALLFSLNAHAGEIMPAVGDESEYVQEALDEYLLPTVIELAGITVEPIIEDVRLSGRAKRIFLGPLAGGSHISLRIRITDADGITEEVFSDEAGAWRGTFQPGNDYEMLQRVAEAAAVFVRTYRPVQSSVVPAEELPNQD